jgi:thioredoxin 1
MELPKVDDFSFNHQVICRKGLVVTCFIASWCQSCGSIIHSITQAKEIFNHRLTVFLADIKTNKKAAKTFTIRSIPTLLLFRDGNLITRTTGPTPKDRIIKAIEEALGHQM